MFSKFSFILLFVTFALSAFADNCWVETKQVYNMPISQATANAWENPDPSAIKISFVKGGGRNGGDAISFKVLKPINKLLVIKGPEFTVPQCSESVTRRLLKMKMVVRQPNFVDGSVGICMIAPSNNSKYPGIAGNRDFSSAYYSFRAKNAEWELVDRPEVGCEIRNNNKERKIRLTIDFMVKDGKGEYLIDSLKIDEICTVSHRINSEKLGNIFCAENGAVKIQWADSSKMKDAFVTVSDEENRKIQSFKVAPASKESVVELKSRGFYSINANAVYNDGKTLSTTATAAVIGAVLPESVRKASRFGVMRNHMGVERAVELGSNMESGFFNMNAVAPDKDGKLVCSMKTTDKHWTPPFIRLEGMTGGLPFWLRDPRTKGFDIYPPLDWDKFEKAVELWVSNHPNLADYIAPYHEVNGAWHGTNEELVKFHNIFAAATKRAKPDQKLSAPVFCNNDVDYLMKLVKMGILKNIDAVNMHPYVNGTAPEKEFIKEIIRLQNELKKEGYGHLPIYFTEFGWSCDNRDWQAAVDSITRARYCARSLILCAARDIAGLVYFAAKNYTSDPVEHYWLVKSDDTPWPSLSAFTGVTRELSAVKGGGVYLEVSPNLYVCFFSRNGKSLVVAWTMDKSEYVKFPELPLSIRSMTGSLISPSETVKLTPSPRYIEFASEKFSKLADCAETIKAFPGDTVKVDGKVIMMPRELKLSSDAKSAVFDSNAAAGEYAFVVEKDGAYRAVRVLLQNPIDISFKNYKWDGSDKKMSLVFAVNSKLKNESAGVLNIVCNSKKIASEKFSASSASDSEVSIAIPSVSGKRIKGNAVFEISTPIKRTVDVPFELTPTAVDFARDSDLPPDWNKIQAFDFSNWQSAPADLKENQVSPAKAKLQLYANKIGIYIRVVVDDAEHVQKKGSWPYMPKEDSVGFIFDMDSGKPWEFNNINIGYNGHRVSEYAVSLTESNEKQWWCYKAYFVAGNTGPVFGQKLNIFRDDKAKQTTYEFLVPWKLVGAKEVPQKNSIIGFSLVVNDKNKFTPKKMLKFGNGIPSPMKTLQILLK